MGKSDNRVFSASDILESGVGDIDATFQNRWNGALLLADSGYLEFSFPRLCFTYSYNLGAVFEEFDNPLPTIDELLSLIEPAFIPALHKSMEEYRQQGYQGVFQVFFRTRGAVHTSNLVRVKTVVEFDAEGNPLLARTLLQNISQLSAIEQSLKMLIDNTKDLIALFDNNFLLVNHNASFVEFVSRFARQEVVSGWRFPVTDSGVLAPLSDALQLSLSGRHIRRELTIGSPETGEKCVEVFISPIKKANIITHISLFARDIAHRKEAERRLNEYLTFLETLLETVPIPIFYKDIKGRYIGCNSVFESYTGYKKKELIGKTVFELYPVELAGMYHKYDVELFGRGGNQIYEGQMLFRDGTMRDIIYHKATFTDSQGDVAGLIGAIYDVTEKNLVERSLREINLTKDKLISIIAHDLKNPFSQVIGFSEVILNNLYVSDLSSIERNVGYIRSAALSAYELLLNLLDWSRLETGRLIFNPRQINLSGIINEVIEGQRVFAEQKNINLFSNVLCEIYLRADENMVKSILRNLIGNAIKFTPERGTVFVNCTFEAAWVRVKVKDNGCGMDSALSDEILYGDKAVSRPGTANEKGTGLGLRICRDFIERHGGSFQIQSTQGSGSEFSFTLPLPVGGNK